MEITEIRIKLMDNPEDRLRAFCSIIFDHCFVIRDLKIIEGNNGPFIAMPSRKLSMHCSNCNSKNHLRARFCNQCGKRVRRGRQDSDGPGRPKLYADIAHPINAECREEIQSAVVKEFFKELERAKLPDYVSRYDDAYEIKTVESQETIRHAPTGKNPLETVREQQPQLRVDDKQAIREPHQPKKSADVPAPNSDPAEAENMLNNDDNENAGQFGTGLLD